MTHIIIIGIGLIITCIISILYVKAIDIMDKEHPDYKGEDFLN